MYIKIIKKKEEPHWGIAGPVEVQLKYRRLPTRSEAWEIKCICGRRVKKESHCVSPVMRDRSVGISPEYSRPVCPQMQNWENTAGTDGPYSRKNFLKFSNPSQADTFVRYIYNELLENQ